MPGSVTYLEHALGTRQREKSDRDVTTAGANADLIETLFEQPYSRISTVVERCRVSRPTAAKWLRELAMSNLLGEVKVGREKFFINHRMLSVLRG